MKLTTLLLLVSLIQVSAKSYSQQVSLTVKDAPLEQVLQMVKAQTGYVFFYDNKDLQSLSVTLRLQHASIEETLNSCFKEQPLTYKIVDKNIVISRKEPGLLQKIGSFLSLPRNITGTVTDENGNAAFGVTVMIKGAKSGTITDENGKFTISAANGNDIIVFSSLTMETLEMPLNNRTDLKVSLKTKNNQLKEVTVSVNNGYQTLTKERSTGSVVTINAATLEQRYNPNLLDQIEGRVPGLITYATGLTGSTASTQRNTVIRGVSTIRANTSVLLVIDGLPVEGTIDDINPYDVESISVLKDAAAASIYGARASNGVIVVTTKKAKPGRTTIEASTDFTIKQKPDYSYLKYMTGAQQVDFESNYYSSYFNNPPAGTDPRGTTAAYINTFNYAISPVAYLYYQQATGAITSAQLSTSLANLKNNDFVSQYRNSANLNELMQQYNLAIRTGGNKYQSSLVLNYKSTNKGIINAENGSLNIFYKGTYNVAKWLDVDFGVNSVYNHDKSQANSSATTPLNVPAYTQLTDAGGNHTQYTLSDANAYNTSAASTITNFKPLNFNHLDELGRDFTKTNQLNSRLYVHGIASIIDGLKFSTQFQYEDLRTDVNTYDEADSYTWRRLYDVYTVAVRNSTTNAISYVNLLPSTGGRLATSGTRGGNYTFRNQFDYNKTYGKHAFNALAGFELRQTFTRVQRTLLLGYNDQLLTQQTNSVNYNPTVVFNGATSTGANTITIPAINGSQAPAFYGGSGYTTSNDYTTYFSNAVGATEVQNRYASTYGNLTYTYDNRYNAFGSVRKDVANLFGADTRLKGRPFYSFGLGWNAHNEAFIKPLTVINYLKLRATYGLTGNVDATTTSYLTATSSTNTVTRLPWSIIGQPANPKLRWELTHTSNLGLDFGLLKNRLNGTVDLYYKKSVDLLASKYLDASTGFATQIINNGTALNKGTEITLDGTWLKSSRKNGFVARTLYTFGINSNKVITVDNTATSPLLLTGAFGRYTQKNYPVNSLFSYQYAGLNATGLPTWKKADGSLTTGTISSLGDMVFSGRLTQPGAWP